MNAIPCRDCGYMLEPTDRGCPRCALNLEAEGMIDRVFWQRIVPGLILLAALIIVLLIYARS